MITSDRTLDTQTCTSTLSLRLIPGDLQPSEHEKRELSSEASSEDIAALQLSRKSVVARAVHMSEDDGLQRS